MIVFVDVDYRATGITCAACVGARDWGDAATCFERVTHAASPPAEYVPGQFFQRELPFVLDVLADVPDVDSVVIDGYVWLASERPGLGAHLFERLGGRTPVIGVAKRGFQGNDMAVPVVRGSSSRPLYVTAAGVDREGAAANVARMHGAHRLPTILKRVDRLARDA